MVEKIDRKTLRKWLHIHRRRLEYALYQYSLGVITAGSVIEELRILKEVEAAATEGGLSIVLGVV